MSRYSVKFSPRLLRSPRELSADEKYVINTFNKHVYRCRACSVYENSREYRCQLCHRGQDYGRDVMDYIRYENGRYVSEVDFKTNLGRTELIMPYDCGAASTFLRFKNAQLDQNKRVSSDRPNVPRAGPSTERQCPVANPVLVEPILSGIHRGPRPGSAFVYVTVPSFTLPIRLSDLQMNEKQA